MSKLENAEILKLGAGDWVGKELLKNVLSNQKKRFEFAEKVFENFSKSD